MDDQTRDLPKKQRLHRRREYLEAYSRGRKFHTPHFVLFVLENEKRRHRLGITVSRRVGKAVTRNRIKRRLREVFRDSKSKIPFHCDFVVNVKHAAVGASVEELSAEFAEAVTEWLRTR